MAPPLTIWSPPRPSLWQQFRREPAAFLARWLYRWAPPIDVSPPAEASNPITIVCISDTHQAQPEVPDGDLLLHAGDLTNHGSFEELQAQLDWLASLPHRHKVVIAGNHDRLLDPEYVARFPDRICEYEGQARADLEWHHLIYLNRTSKMLEFGQRRLNIYGSPWTPQFGTFAFQYPPIRDIWTGAIPEGTDVVLTHGPPKGYLDLRGKGCPHLMREVARARPRALVFGHVHAGHGREEVGFRGVETCYQRVMAGNGGLGTTVVMMAWLLGAWVTKLVRSALGQGDGCVPRTTMINASLSESQPVAVLVI
ncbi:hypothetical protein F66182_544 [Fusarium sp. NRRL 66182]|nr:hypothetical protein F66182_544 [Fusarium sp. NRRL 66182]